jgi:Signal transduction histidine kinase
MRLKTRLIISFFIIILVPIVLTTLALTGVTYLQIRSIEQQFEITGVTYEDLSNSPKMLSRFTKRIYEEVQKIAAEEPTLFLDVSYLENINADLEQKSSYLVARKDEQIYYIGLQEELEVLQKELPEYGDSHGNSDTGTYIGWDIQALVKQVDFLHVDGSEGTIFIITSAKIMIPQLKSLLYEAIISVVLILLITSAILTTWIYRGVTRPLRKLKVATQNIKEGNLDFVIEENADDEIGKLCVDFEEMRKRLKMTAEERLKDDQESKELISNISHDLKTPITAVKGYVEGIMDGVADSPEKMDRYIRTIYNKANEMDRLINELTFYSKIDTNRMPYTFSKINITNYFEDCIEELGLDLEAKNVELAYFNYTEENTMIIADAEQLKRVINNIVNNSVKYRDKKKGYINIRIKDVGDFIQVEIEDNGKGIGQKELAYIFDRFYRTDTSRNSAQGGSGIGLSIVKKIIDDHGGKIWVTSKEATGTVMYFVLRKYQEVPNNE